MFKREKIHTESAQKINNKAFPIQFWKNAISIGIE